MLTAIPSQHKLMESSLETLKSRRVEFDSALCSPPVSPSISQFDAIDNPLHFSKNCSDTEKNIFKQMKYERNRLYSFQNKWPLREIRPESLAEAGLFYLQHEDKVQCPFCFVIISNWIHGDNPLREHMKRRPKCPFLMGSDVGNVPLVPEKHQISFASVQESNCLSHPVNVSFKPKHPRMNDVKKRILTFSGWPLSRPLPQQLAECGLYYSGICDVVTCFFCDGTLANWEPNDDPWIEHGKFFPDCPYLAIAKRQFNSSPKIAAIHRKEAKESLECKQNPMNGMPSIDIVSDIIEEALDIFPKYLVLEAMKRKGGKILSLQELCDDILELKQKQKEIQPLNPINEKPTPSSSSSNADVLLCKVCMDREKGAVFQPCGHFVSCWNCANIISNCPVCRTPIIHKIRTYIS